MLTAAQPIASTPLAAGAVDTGLAVLISQPQVIVALLSVRVATPGPDPDEATFIDLDIDVQEIDVVGDNGITVSA